MKQSIISLAVLMAAVLVGSRALAAEGKDNIPILRLNAGGPISSVHSLAFTPGGNVLYAAGRDKLVHAWKLVRGRDGSERFVYERDSAWRVPIGPDFQGAINAIAVSADGRWLAAAGRGRLHDPRVAGFRDDGFLWSGSTLTKEMRLDEGTIYVFNTRTGEAKSLRGHLGTVYSLKFAPWQEGKPAVLVSAADEFYTSQSKGPGRYGAIRVWDIDQAKQISALGDLQSPTIEKFSPDLDVWHTGNRPADVRVAIAWGDNNRPIRDGQDPVPGQFRVWDVGQNRLVPRPTRSPYARTAAVLPGRRAAIVGTWEEVGLWTLPAGNGLIGEFARIDGLPQAIPLEVALFKSRANGPTDHAAFVVAEQPQPGSFSVSFRFVNLQTRRLLPGAVEIWSGGLGLPIIATSAAGEYLAVSGGPGNEVAVYRIADLLAGQKAPYQQLRGRGYGADSVEFAKSGEKTGLVLKSNRLFSREDVLVFDVKERSLQRDHSNWKTVTPDLAGWQVTANTGGTSIEVKQNGTFQRTIDLQLDREEDGETRYISALAVCGPTEHCPVPVAAVATQTSDIPRFGLYNLQTGEEIRRFSGHVEPITGLAFSEDGRLLASVAEDQTVRVWWLADIGERLLGKHGLLRGVTLDYNATLDTPAPVASKDNGIIVKDGRADLPSGTRIIARIERDVQGNDVRVPLDSAWDLYDYVAAQKPGETIRLLVLDGGRERPVSVLVNQAIDERKPLFSLFMQDVEKQIWIGWHPIGKYDAHGDGTEASLGWHFNTGDQSRPTTFASSDEYRNQNFTPGLLQHLIDNGKPPVKAVPKPKLSLDISALEDEQLARNNTNREWLTRTRQLTAHLEVLQDIENGLGSDKLFPTENIRSLQWKLGGPEEEFQDFRLAVGQTWEADLSGASWQHGKQELHVRLVTDESPPRTLEASEVIWLQPPPVQINPTPALEQLRQAAGFLPRTHHKQFDLDVKLSDLADDVTVEVIHKSWQDGKLQERRSEPQSFKKNDPVLTVQDSFSLDAGINEILVIARNRAALPGREQFETATETFRIEFVDSGPPVIAIKTLQEVPGGSLLKINGLNVVAHAPRVKITGEIASEVALKSAQMIVSRKDQESFNRTFEVKEGKVAFDEEIKLQPGAQTVTISATTVGGREDRVQLIVDYRPRAPMMTWLKPERAELSISAPEKPQLELSAQLQSPDGINLSDHQLQQKGAVVVTVNGAAIELPVKIDVDPSDAASGTLTATVPLKHGENRVEISLSNAWESQSRSTARTVDYRLPPQIIEMTVGQLSPLEAEAICLIQSPGSLGKPSVTAALNGQPLASDTLTVAASADNPDKWQLKISKFILSEGKNRLSVRARNSDGVATRDSRDIIGEKPPEPATVQIDLPAASAIQTKRVSVSFTVTSTTPLKRVDVITVCHSKGGERSRHRFEAEELPKEKNKFGEYVFAETWEVVLESGDNEVQVQAANDGPTAMATARLNVLNEPVGIVVDGIRVPAEEGKESRVIATALRSGYYTFAQAAPDGHVQLVGHVKIPENKRATSTGQPPYLIVTVNGFLQDVLLEKPKSAQSPHWTFEVDIVLNRSKGNRIRLELPDLENSPAPMFIADCQNPETRQHLHLIVVSASRDADSVDRNRLGEAIQSRVLDVLGGENSAFAHVSYHTPLVGRQATFTQLKRRFRKVNRDIRRRQRRGQPNDVLLVYYYGKEVSDQEGGEYVLATSQNWETPQTNGQRVSGSWLNRKFDAIPGAKLLIRDITFVNAVVGGPRLQVHSPLGAPGGFRFVRAEESVSLDLLIAFERAIAILAQNTQQAVTLAPLSAEVKDVARSRDLTVEPEVPDSLQDLVVAAGRLANF